MKAISMIILLCFTFNVLATPIKSLETSFDNYSYAITVEWDQKDQNFYDAKTNEFMTELSYLMLNQGVTKDVILNLAEKKMGSRAGLDLIRMKLSLMGDMNPTNLAELLKDHSHDLYSRGASWDGDTWGTIGIVAAIALLVGYAIWFSIKYECVEYDYRPRSGCDSSNCYRKVCVQYEER